MYSQLDYAPHEKGVGLIVVILVLSFMMSVGLVLITTTSTGPEVAGNIRDQQQAFDAAEAGFDTTWLTIDGYFTEGGWTSFDTHYLQEPSGIDLPLQQNYFRRKTNEELLDLIGDFEAGTPSYANILFYKQMFIPTSGGGFDPRITYTAFLIDDEAAAGAPDAGDALLICIGAVKVGSRVTTARLEIKLAIELPGT